MSESFGGKPERTRTESPENLEKNPKPLSKDYFDIQLQFAKAVSEKTGISFEHSVFTHTNFFVQLSFGTLDSRDEHEPRWQTFVKHLAEQDDKTEFVYQTYLAAPPEAGRETHVQFGCFSLEPVDAEGVVHLHFSNKESDGSSPLSSEKLDKRKQELTALFRYIKDTYGDKAKVVKGNSWLYGMGSYQRLFPPTYVESRTINRDSRRFQGNSRWGQFLDHNGNVVEDVIAHFLENLNNIHPEHIADAFPLPTYTTEAPIKDFYNYYGITDQPGSST